LKVFLTGANGFIGTHLAKELIGRNIEVVAYDLVPPNQTLDGIQYEAGTIMDESHMGRLMKGCDAVFHLAAILGVKRADRELLRCLKVNIEGSFSVFRAAALAGVERILLTSSSEIFGDISHGDLDEKSAHNPKSGYAVSKLAAEYGLKGFCREYGQNYNIIRYFNVYGPRQVAEFVVPRFIRMAQNGIAPTIYGDGSQIRSFCHIFDASRATMDLFLSGRGENTEFNIGNDLEPITIEGLARTICQEVNSAIEPVFVDFDDSDRTRSREIFYRIPNIGKLRAAVGFEPKISLTAGIRTILKSGEIPASWKDSSDQGD
jgi:UDP-glucose 4-epimerase